MFRPETLFGGHKKSDSDARRTGLRESPWVSFQTSSRVAGPGSMSGKATYLWLCSTAPAQQLPSVPQHLALELAQEVNEKVVIAAAPMRIRIFFMSGRAYISEP